MNTYYSHLYQGIDFYKQMGMRDQVNNTPQERD